MTKKTKIATRLLVVLAGLTLISCCFLGTTFARYTSGSTGKASVEVAKWEVSVTGDGVGETAVSFGKLSPSDAEYSADAFATDGARMNATGKVKVATIENKSAVDAVITVAAGDLTLNTVTDKTVDYVEETAKSVFSLKLYYTTVATPDETTLYTEITAEAANFVMQGTDSAEATGKIAKNTPVYIYAEVIWISQDTATVSGDAIDTMVGQNVTSAEAPITYTATQDSKLPE